MKNMNSLTLAVGAAFATTVLSTAAFAGSNPFAMQKLDGGYQVAAADADKKMDGKCGEGKCGAKTKNKDGKCGEGKCGADKMKKKDGKCGEGKCGADKKKEGSCGADKKMDAPKAEEAK